MEELPADEHVVGTLADFPPGKHRVVEVAGREVGVFNIRGEFYALPNICPHQTGPLCRAKKLIGSLDARKEGQWKREWVHDGEVIACPWHGLEYHVPSGQCLAFPHIRLRRYDVRIDGEQIVIRLPSGARRAAPR
jgi:nitrite reductase (NADH) small subunit